MSTKLSSLTPVVFLSNCMVEIRKIVYNLTLENKCSLSYHRQRFFSFLSLINIRSFAKIYLYWYLGIGLYPRIIDQLWDQLKTLEHNQIPNVLMWLRIVSFSANVSQTYFWSCLLQTSVQAKLTEHRLKKKSWSAGRSAKGMELLRQAFGLPLLSSVPMTSGIKHAGKMQRCSKIPLAVALMGQICCSAVQRCSPSVTFAHVE